MTCFVFLAAMVVATAIEELPINWGFLPHLINDTLILWGGGGLIGTCNSCGSLPSTVRYIQLN